MVNQETSESLLDKLILQIFEEQEDAFSFPLTTMKETRDFVRLLNRQGFTYEMVSAEIDEKPEAFRNWRLGGGPDTIGRRTMVRINKPLQEAMLSDGEDEEEETVRNGTTGEKASGGARRKKSMDAGARARRSSKADSVDGEKKGKLKEEEVAEEGGTKKTDLEKKGQGRVETGKMDDGRNKVTASDDHSKPSSPNHNNAKSEIAEVGEKREATEKNNATTVVATVKDATPNNIKTNDNQLSKAGKETVAKQDGVVQAAKKDASKELETSTDAKKNEHKAEIGKKEPAKNTETNEKEEDIRSVVTNQKEPDKKSAKKPKTTTEESSKLPASEKAETKDKPEMKKKDSKAEQKEQRTETEKRTNEDEGINKASTGSLKTPPAVKVPSKLSGAGPEKSPDDPAKSVDQVTTGSTLSSNQGPISPTSKPKTEAESPQKILETVSPPTTTNPTSNAEALSRGEKRSDPAKPDEKSSAHNNSKANKLSDGSETKLLPDKSKVLSMGQTDRSIPKMPPTETMPSPLTTGNIVRSKSEIVNSKIDETPSLPRTSSDNTGDLLRPTASPVSPKPDSEATNGPASETMLDESYDSDLDSETTDHSAEDRALIDRLRSLKRSRTKDGPGHLFVFSDTPAATGTGKHRVRIGNSRFPEKRLQQAQLFNPDIRMVTSVAVATRKDALCRAQEELKSMSLRGKRGWYWGSLEVILKVVTDLSVEKEDEDE